MKKTIRFAVNPARYGHRDRAAVAVINLGIWLGSQRLQAWFAEEIGDRIAAQLLAEQEEEP